MKYIYMSVVIHYFSRKSLAPICAYYEQTELDKVPVRHELNEQAAHKLMWELKLAGGTKEIETNMFCPSIHTVTVTYWARH